MQYSILPLRAFPSLKKQKTLFSKLLKILLYLYFVILSLKPQIQHLISPTYFAFPINPHISQKLYS